MARPCQSTQEQDAGDASAFSTGMAHPLKFEARRAEATLDVCCSLDAVLLGHCTRAERLSVARLGCWYAAMARCRAHRHRLRLAFEAVGPLDSAQGSRNGKGPGRCLALTARTSKPRAWRSSEALHGLQAEGAGVQAFWKCPVRDSNPPHRIKSPGLYQMS